MAGVTSLSMYEPVERRRIFLAIETLKARKTKDGDKGNTKGNERTDVNLQVNDLPSVEDG